MIEKIDGHSHFGTDAFFPVVGTVERYKQQAKSLGIKQTLAMPVACPKVRIENGYCILLQNTYGSNNTITHHQVRIMDDGKIEKLKHVEGYNPYESTNTQIYKLTQQENDLKFHYVPLIHPYYYSEDDLNLQKVRGAKAIKIHGISGGVEPEKIREEFFRKIEQLKIPVILHTDYYQGTYIQMQNTPDNWLSQLQKYDIKVAFTHGVRLSPMAINIINNDDRYITGLAPDILLTSDSNNLMQQVEDYYKYCFSKFKRNKTFFDIDYPWNIHSFKDISLDWSFLERIEQCLDIEQLQDFYQGNIKSFLGLQNKKDNVKQDCER